MDTLYLQLWNRENALLMFCLSLESGTPARGLVAPTVSGSSLSSQAFLETCLESWTEVCVSSVNQNPVELMLKISHGTSTLY